MKSELGNLLNPPLNLLRPPKFEVTQEPPSIVEQAKEWGECRIVDFRQGKPHDTEYFNCSYLSRRDRDWLLVRRSKYHPDIFVGLNDLVAFGLTNGEPQVGHVLKTIKHDPMEHNEDGRIFQHGGFTYVSACSFVWYSNKSRWTGAHQTVWQFDDKWNCKKRFDPIYGNNGPTNGARLGHEKNWLFYTFDNRLFLLYKSQPLTIVEMDWDFKVIKDHKSEWKSPWRHGEIRGGSNPILGPDGLLWTFFHSSLPMALNQKRRYAMGAMAYDPIAPFTVRKITPKPLLIGSKKDRWYQDKPAVVFPGSCTLRNGFWTGALGVNDLDSAIFTIHHSKLEKLAVAV